MVYFRADQMGFEKSFDSITFKRMDALRDSVEQSSIVSQLIDLLAILRRIRIERYLAKFCRISNLHNTDRSSNATRSTVAYKNV